MLKKFLLSALIVTILSGAIALSSPAKAVMAVDELIIMVPDAEAGRNDRTISTALTSIPGVEVVGYCNSQKCFYLHVDRTQQPDNRNILTALRGLGYGMDIKTSGTIQEAQSNCADRN